MARFCVTAPFFFLVILALGSCSPCASVLPCPTWTFVDFDPPLSEEGRYSVIVQATKFEHRIECTFEVPLTREDADCTAGTSGTISHRIVDAASGVTSLLVLDPSLPTMHDVQITLVRDGSELRAVDLSLSYEETDREDSESCEACSEAHGTL